MKIIRLLLKHDRTKSGNRFGQSVREHEQLCSERTAPHSVNKGFEIARVPCFADTFVQGVSAVLRMNFNAENPRLRKAAKR
jgi:hypothetical protein